MQPLSEGDALLERERSRLADTVAHAELAGVALPSREALDGTLAEALSDTAAVRVGMVGEALKVLTPLLLGAPFDAVGLVEAVAQSDTEPLTVSVALPRLEALPQSLRDTLREAAPEKLPLPELLPELHEEAVAEALRLTGEGVLVGQGEAVGLAQDAVLLAEWVALTQALGLTLPWAVEDALLLALALAVPLRVIGVLVPDTLEEAQPLGSPVVLKCALRVGAVLLEALMVGVAVLQAEALPGTALGLAL